MKLKSFVIFFISILLVSCKTNRSDKLSDSIPSNVWSNYEQLIGTWTELERDNDGFFLYDPCDGGTPQIVVSKDSIVLIHQMDFPTRLSIDNYKISDNSIILKGGKENLESKIEFKIVEPKANFILMKLEHKWGPNLGGINRYKRIMTRENLKSDFRFIKDSCDIEKIQNQEFLPVIYE